MSSLWLSIPIEVLGTLCPLGAYFVHRLLPPYGIADVLQPWPYFGNLINLAAVGGGLAVAGLICLYADLNPPSHSMP